MLKNFLLIAIRKCKRNKFFSFINILGLGIGISAALVIYLIVQHENSYEKFQKDGDRIYRMVSDMTFAGNSEFKNSGVAMPMPEAVRKEVTGIEVGTHFLSLYDPNVSVPSAGSQTPATFKNQKDIVYADEFYFSLFDYDWIAGSKQTALKDPYQVVIDETRAKTYFGNMPANDIIGKQIIYSDTIKVTVAGIVKDFTVRTTDLHFKEFISMATARQIMKDDFLPEQWGSINSNSQFFVKLTKGTTAAKINAQMPALRKKYHKPEEGQTDDTKNHLQALYDIHFNADYDAMEQRQAHKPTLYGLLTVAGFLLLLACINFINLTTAQSGLRAKEIGIRKTAGSSKKQIIFQFLSETFVLTLMATVLSILLAPVLLKMFKGFIPPEVSFASINQPHVWIFLIVLVLMVTLLSGFYPAWVLTRFNPVNVLKGQTFSGNAKTSKAWLRKTLTVTQFIIAQFLIIATLVVSKQVYYSLHKDLGYKKDAIVFFNTRWNFYSDKPDQRRFVLMDQLRTIPEFEAVTLGASSPASSNTSSTTMKVDNGKKITETMVEVKYADSTYFNIYKMKLLAGKWLQTSDTTKEYLINETYAKEMGFAKPADAIGHFVDKGNFKVPIIGVISDFNTKSTRAGIGPLAFASAAKNSYTVHVSLKPAGTNPDQWKNGIAKAEKMFKSIYPEDDFNYHFFDESIASFYKKEQDIASLLKWASGLCIFISCLGLMGLVIYITNTRTKEIGVRKVLGASVVQIVSLLSKDFVALVMVAFIITLPLAWWAMHNWLQNFVYRTSLSWWVFAVTGIGMLLIALFILSIRTIRSATANPVKSLRTE